MSVHTARMQASSAMVRSDCAMIICKELHACELPIQAQAHAEMVKFDLLGETLTEDKWKCATIEYGEQCVLMDGMKLLPILSVTNWDILTLRVSFTINVMIIVFKLSIYQYYINRKQIHRL